MKTKSFLGLEHILVRPFFFSKPHLSVTSWNFSMRPLDCYWLELFFFSDGLFFNYSLSLSNHALHWVVGQAHPLIPGPDGTYHASPPSNLSLLKVTLLVVNSSVLLAANGGELFLLFLIFILLDFRDDIVVAFLGLIFSWGFSGKDDLYFHLQLIIFGSY